MTETLNNRGEPEGHDLYSGFLLLLIINKNKNIRVELEHLYGC